jgi:hypothetical protein
MVAKPDELAGGTMYVSTAFVGIFVGLALGALVGWIVRGWWDRIFGITVRWTQVPFWRRWW